MLTTHKPYFFYKTLVTAKHVILQVLIARDTWTKYRIRQVSVINPRRNIGKLRRALSLYVVYYVVTNTFYFNFTGRVFVKFKFKFAMRT